MVSRSERERNRYADDPEYRQRRLGRNRAYRAARYADDSEYRRKRLASNRAYRALRRDKINAARRQRWATDPEYRERKLGPRRGKSRRNDQLKCHYGISLDDYNAMLAQQNGACAICMKISDRTLSVDHCHTTGVVRGLLCRRCNTGLGCFEDQWSLVLRALDYLGALRGNQ